MQAVFRYVISKLSIEVLVDGNNDNPFTFENVSEPDLEP